VEIVGGKADAEFCYSVGGEAAAGKIFARRGAFRGAELFFEPGGRGFVKIEEFAALTMLGGFFGRGEVAFGEGDSAFLRDGADGLREADVFDFLNEGENIAVFVATDSDIAARGPVLSRALKALAEGYEFAAHHPAAAEQILIADNETALGNAKRIVDATGNATSSHFLDQAGVWGPETDADYRGLERILAGGHLIKTSPAISDLYTNALLPSG